MKIKALITTLAILGSSSVALASPSFGFNASARVSWSASSGARTPVVRDHRDRAPVVLDTRTHVHPGNRYLPAEPMMFPTNNVLKADASVYKGALPLPRYKRTTYRDSYRPGYAQAASWLTITEPTRIDRGRQYVTDLPDLGAFSTVRLQYVTGSTTFDKVLIRFKGGGEQLVKLNQKLDRWNPTIDIRLTSTREIHGFVIYGSTDRGSAYQLLAR